VPAAMIELLPIDRLIPDPRNVKRHTPEQAARLAGMIREFGFTDLVLIDGDNVIRAGHGRKEAISILREAGVGYYVHATQTTETDHVPCVRLSRLSPTQLRALVVANNRSPEVAGSYDMEALTLEVGALSEAGFDMAALGFSEDELDALLSTLEPLAEGEGEGDGDKGGAVLQWKGKKVPLQAAELRALDAALAAHVEESQTEAGFVSSILGLA
jgi:hypothetical protein